MTINTSEYEVKEDRLASLIPRRFAHSFTTETRGRTRQSTINYNFFIRVRILQYIYYKYVYKMQKT